MQVKNTDHLLEEIFFGVIESVLIDSSVLFVAVMQTPTPHAITTITVSTSGQDGENTKWIAFRINYVPQEYRLATFWVQ